MLSIPPILPRIHDRIRFMDLDTNELSDYIITSRAGKATGINQYWLNVKNLQNGIMKSVDNGMDENSGRSLLQCR